MVKDILVDVNYNAGVGIGIDPSGTALLNLPAGTTPATGGILWGTDTNLYRDSADFLKTDDTFQANLLGVGVAPSLYIPFRSYKTWSDDVGGTRYAGLFSAVVNPVTANLNSTSYGTHNQLTISDSLATAGITGVCVGVGSQVLQNNMAASPRLITGLEGFRSTVQSTGVGPFGTVTSVHGFRSMVTTPASGVWTNRYGFFVDQPVITAGGAITNSYGLYVEDLGLAATVNSYAIYIGAQAGSSGLNYAIYVAGGISRFEGGIGLGIEPALGRLQFVAGTTAANGIYFGTDVTLYRSGAVTLKTDGTFSAAVFQVAGVALASTHLSDTALLARLAGPTFTGILTTPAITVSGSGKTMITLADTGAQLSGLTIGGDTNLYRSAADTLKTDDSLEVIGSIKAKGAETSSRAFSMAMC